MSLARKRPALPRPHTTIETRTAALRFYLGDCVDVLRAMPAGGVGAVVTSPPYNLGVRYRSYHDALPHERYLEWTDSWIAATVRALGPHGSLFLNVGTKPTDPWTAMDVAQTARRHLHLQNTIHWIKSIAIDKESAGVAVNLDRNIAVGHYKPINSDRYVNDCHEFIFHFTPQGPRRWIGGPSGWSTRTPRTSPAGAPAATIDAAEGRPGSFRMSRSSAVTKTGPTRPRFLPESLNTACGCTDSRA
jgi:hypothetical protein